MTETKDRQRSVIMAKRFQEAYSIVSPPSPYATLHQYPLAINITPIMILNAELMSSSGRLRDKVWAWSGGMPLVFPPPDQVQYLLEALITWTCEWLSSPELFELDRPKQGAVTWIDRMAMRKRRSNGQRARHERDATLNTALNRHGFILHETILPAFVHSSPCRNPSILGRK